MQRSRRLRCPDPGFLALQRQCQHMPPLAPGQEHSTRPKPQHKAAQRSAPWPSGIHWMANLPPFSAASWVILAANRRPAQVGGRRAERCVGAPRGPRSGGSVCTHACGRQVWMRSCKLLHGGRPAHAPLDRLPRRSATNLKKPTCNSIKAQGLTGGLVGRAARRTGCRRLAGRRAGTPQPVPRAAAVCQGTHVGAVIRAVHGLLVRHDVTVWKGNTSR